MASKGSARAPTTSNTGVRRNLFHHHLSRRPTSASTSTSSTAQQQDRRDEADEIVAKDHNGNYVVRVPILAPLDEDQMPEEELGPERESEPASLVSKTQQS